MFQDEFNSNFLNQQNHYENLNVVGGFRESNTTQDLSNLKYDKSTEIMDMSFIEKINP